jgi:hypothetical protein
MHYLISLKKKNEKSVTLLALISLYVSTKPDNERRDIANVRWIKIARGKGENYFSVRLKRECAIGWVDKPPSKLWHQIRYFSAWLSWKDLITETAFSAAFSARFIFRQRCLEPNENCSRSLVPKWRDAKHPGWHQERWAKSQNARALSELEVKVHTTQITGNWVKFCFVTFYSRGLESWFASHFSSVNFSEVPIFFTLEI